MFDPPPTLPFGALEAPVFNLCVPFPSLPVGVAVMHMQSPPVNSLSLDFLTELCISIEKLEMDKSCRGLVITSVP